VDNVHPCAGKLPILLGDHVVPDLRSQREWCAWCQIHNERRDKIVTQINELLDVLDHYDPPGPRYPG
jgi:hypothetical protein